MVTRSIVRIYEEKCTGARSTRPASKRRRRRIQVMAQISAFCIRARRKTHIMHGTNLSGVRLKKYLTLLTSLELLAHNPDGYVTTQKGHRFLEAFAQLNNVLARTHGLSLPCAQGAGEQ